MMLGGLNLLYPVAGLMVGLIVGLTGVGGGSLMTPLLVLLFGVAPHTAVGTALLYAAAPKSVGTAVHPAGGSVDWTIVRRLAIGSVPATALTLVAISQLGAESRSVTHAITGMLGVGLMLTSVSILFRPAILAWGHKRFGVISEQRAVRWTVVSGVVLGVLVSLSSVGAGALGVTVLFLLYPTIPTVRIVGSDLAHAVPLTLLAGVGHWYWAT